MLIWTFSHISFYYIHLLFLFGLIVTAMGFLLEAVPFVSLYKLQFKTAGILVIFMSLYLEGGLSVNNEWLIKVSQMQADINNIEINAGKIVNKVSTDYAAQIQAVRDAQAVVQHDIQRDTTQVNTGCKLNTTAVDILNEAAKNPGKVKK